MRPLARLVTALALASALASLAGCRDDRRDRPTCPGGPGACPTLASLWPSEDGTAWTYSYAETIWGAPPAEVYPDRESVPPAPGTAEAYSAMLALLAAHPDTSVEAIYRLQFRGRLTTASGAEGQNLVATLYGNERAAAGAGPRALAMVPEDGTAGQVGSADRFLARLAEARPDLRARIAETSVRTFGSSRLPPDGPETSFAPLFLHGYCWVRLPDRIGGYGDLDRELAWIYLTADLAPGTTFRHQLVRALADDVFLHGRVTRRLEAVTEAGIFRDCLECFYLIDYGVASLTTEEGQELGFSRTVDVGTIVYAPGVGPVQSVELRSLSTPAGNEPSIGAAIRLDLVGRSGP